MNANFRQHGRNDFWVFWRGPDMQMNALEGIIENFYRAGRHLNYQPEPNNVTRSHVLENINVKLDASEGKKHVG